jgi:3-oxoacyl-[acyl-carrier-protein] synthase-3
MRLDGVYLAGLGAYLPEIMSIRTAVENGLYAAELAAESGWTGVAVAGTVPAPDLAVRAARRALDHCGHPPDEFALLVHARNLPQGPESWPAQSYIQARTIGGSAPAVEVSQSCNGTLAAMELSSCYLTASGTAAALVTAADNFGNPLWDRFHYAAGAGTNRSSITGDAGAAVVLSRRAGFARLLAIGSMSVPTLEEMYRSGVPLFPPEPTLGRPADLGGRFANYRERDPEAAEAAKNALQRARTAIARRTLAEAGVDASRITRVTHVFSGGARYIESVLEPLGIDPSRGMLDFGRRTGHLGACDQLVGLDHLLSGGEVGVGDHVLMLANGGASLSCAIVRITSDRGAAPRRPVAAAPV